MIRGTLALLARRAILGMMVILVFRETLGPIPQSRVTQAIRETLEYKATKAIQGRPERRATLGTRATRAFKVIRGTLALLVRKAILVTMATLESRVIPGRIRP